MIDLHTHTTASDGRSTPGELASCAAAAAVTVLGLTDHDTVGGCEQTAASCRTHGIAFVPGIEISTVKDGMDVHVLGYFIDTRSAVLHALLAEQRRLRIDRVREMIARLARHGIALDADRIVQPALDDPAKSAGRPWVARALVDKGYVATTDEAFERWLEHGKPAFVPRQGPSPAEAFGWIHEAGGLASLAHPGLIGRDDWIRGFAEAGLDAIEAYHTDHDAPATQRYLSLAVALQLGVTGGSDFHGDAHGGSRPGGVSLPEDEYDRLIDRWKRRRQSSAG